MKGLHAKPDVVFREDSGWILAEDLEALTMWSFPPPDYPAYPAAIKRQLVEGNDGISMQTAVHCEGSKKACDDLVRKYEAADAHETAAFRNLK